MANYGGYLDLGKLVGDHRGLWIKIPQADLIGFHQHKTIPPLARHIRLDEPRTARRLKMVLHHILLKYNFYGCISALYQLSVHPLIDHNTIAYEILDTLIVKLMHKSDKNSEGK